MADRVIETEDGFDCIVEGKRFGTWRSHALAKAGMKVEQERAARAIASSLKRKEAEHAP